MHHRMGRTDRRRLPKIRCTQLRYDTVDGERSRETSMERHVGFYYSQNLNGRLRKRNEETSARGRVSLKTIVSHKKKNQVRLLDEPEEFFARPGMRISAIVDETGFVLLQ